MHHIWEIKTFKILDPISDGGGGNYTCSQLSFQITKGKNHKVMMPRFCKLNLVHWQTKFEIFEGLTLFQPLKKQVQGTTRCVNSDKGGQNSKSSLYLLICFISSRHLTKPQTYGTIHQLLVPFINFWCHSSTFGTIHCYNQYHSIPFCADGCH